MKFSALFLFAFLPLAAMAQDVWPLTIGGVDGTVVRLYEPKYDSLKNNQLTGSAVFSIRRVHQIEPVFGIYHFIAAMELDDSSNLACVLTLDVTDIKFSGNANTSFTNYIKVLIQNILPGTGIHIKQANFYHDELINDPPEIIYNERPAILVLIDGEPLFHSTHVQGAAIMSNATYPIVSADGAFYLYAKKHWYKSIEPTGPFSNVKYVPAICRSIQQTIDKNNKANSLKKGKMIDQGKAAESIFIRRTPAVLIQTDNAPKFAALKGTPIQYVTNSKNDLFRDSSTGKFYVLLAGRWYEGLSLQGPWHYVLTNKPPVSFLNIPPALVRSGVIASVAGTTEAKNAVLKAGIPTIKKVKLGKALLHIVYDGGPRFQNIPGTRLQYAVNTQTPVIRDFTTFYAVDGGVWFEAQSPFGPWTVSAKRPAGVDRIPPSCSIYRIKFVDVYETSGNYVYMGYTAGYLNKFIYAGTVVYGTGYNYTPWIDHIYVGGPTTWH